MYTPSSPMNDVPRPPQASKVTFDEATKYYDFVLIGRFGTGKSTLGNKLLNLKNTAESKIRLFAERESDEKRFIQADEDSLYPTTRKCKLMSNEDTKIRVLDVPGFSFFGEPDSINLQIVRWIIRAHIDFKLMVRQIVYFLPVRGTLKKADETLQKELRALCHYFGKKVFNCIVVAATLPGSQRYQVSGFNHDDYDITKRAFLCALKAITGNKDIACPPVIYIGLHKDTDEILSKIQCASVLKESTLSINEGVCACCSIRIISNDNKRVCVMTAGGYVTPYTESKCHPLSYCSKIQ